MTSDRLIHLIIKANQRVKEDIQELGYDEAMCYLDDEIDKAWSIHLKEQRKRA